jgi:hypothetical protein
MIQRKTRYNQCALRWALILAVPFVATQAQVLPLDSIIFSPVHNVSHSAGNSFFHSIAVSPNGNIYLAWLDDGPGYRAVFFSRSSNAGLAFSSPQNLSNDFGGSSAPQIAVDATGGIDIVWASLGGSQGGFFSRSVDGGITFSPPVNFADNVASTPAMAFDSSGNIYLAWEDTTLFHNISFSRSTDGGAMFSLPTQMSHRPPIDFARPLSMAVDSAGNINVVWNDCTGDCHIWFSRSTDGGASFSRQTIGGTFDFLPVVGMALDSADNIHIVYNTLPFGEVWLLRSTDGGATFSQVNISFDQSDFPPSPSPCCAQIATDSGGNLNVTWEDDSSVRNFTITFARSIDGGNTFSRTDVSHTGILPQIAIDSSGDIHVVWTGTGTQLNSDVFYSRSIDGGVTFSPPRNISNRSPNAPPSTPGPLIALDSCGNVNVAWADNMAGNFDIFFRRGVTQKSLVRGCVPLIAGH